MKFLFVLLINMLMVSNAVAALVSNNYVDAIVAALRLDVAVKANDADVVHLTGDETISGVKTFTEPVLINSHKSNGPIITLTGTGSTIYFSLVRTGGSEAVLESGQQVSLFGTRTKHPIEIRTNYQTRMTIGTDGSVVLSSAPPPGSDSNQVATTAWVNERIKAMCAPSETE